MNERNKIKKILEEYRGIFEVTDMDVAESMKGQWFFTRYNKDYNRSENQLCSTR